MPKENIRLKANGRSGSRVRLATAGERQTAQEHRVMPVRSREAELRGLGKKTNAKHGEDHRAQQTAYQRATDAEAFGANAGGDRPQYAAERPRSRQSGRAIVR